MAKRLPNDHNARRSLHIERIIKIMDGKLKDEDMPVLLKEVASAVVDLSDNLEELHRAVRGYNGDAGMLTILTRIQTHLGISSDGQIMREEGPPVDDRFTKLIKWLGDRVAPQIVTLIILAVLYLTFGGGR